MKRSYFGKIRTGSRYLTVNVNFWSSIMTSIYLSIFIAIQTYVSVSDVIKLTIYVLDSRGGRVGKILLGKGE